MVNTRRIAGKIKEFDKDFFILMNCSVRVSTHFSRQNIKKISRNQDQEYQDIKTGGHPECIWKNKKNYGIV